MSLLICLASCSTDIKLSSEPDTHEQTLPHDSGIYVQPIQSLHTNFIKGADISTLIEVEANGGQFYDENGQQQDALEVLAEHGINWARIRLWNDPYNVSWVTNILGYDVPGAVGGGTNDLTKTINLAKRAKSLGMQVLLDFHYSDFWTHPGQQYIPDAWVDLTEQQVQQALYDFTYDTLIAMNNSGVFPDMVQIGNEINTGLVSPIGDDVTSAAAIALLQNGIKAVRDAETETNNTAQIMLHLAEGGKSHVFTRAFDAFTTAGLDYDIIGASYYPYWHGSLADLQNTLDTVSQRYNKPVIVVETASAFTLETGPDGGSNIFGSTDEENAGFKASAQGQATAIREVINVIANVPNQQGVGVFYWEPSWLGVSGAGWATGKTNGWENQALFDYEGKVLDSMDVFWKVSTKEIVTPPNIVNIEPIRIEVEQAEPVNLPQQVKALYTDDAWRLVDVTWQNTASSDLVGTYEIKGLVGLIEVSLQIRVIEKVQADNQSALLNDSFETGSFLPWKLGDGDAGLIVTSNPDDVYKGEYAIHFWLDKDILQSLTQTQKVSNGRYKVSLMSMGGDAVNNLSKLIATSADESQTAAIQFSSWGVWHESSVEIEVTDENLTVSLALNEAENTYGNIDHIKAEPISANLLVNAGFESPDISPWIISDQSFGLALTSIADEVYSGQQAMHFWNDNSISTNISQTLTLDNGQYSVSGFFMGGDATNNQSLLKATSGDNASWSQIVFNGWAIWNKSELIIDVIDNSLTVEIILDEAANTWGNFDDILIKKVN
ncbi:glycosyl hydrolase 53 family protein [Catenovulum maritimum]|uniref:glycosyl hydrolase 53 family protein n=1 Tax=Catenovulum maritimum TaxID=1513271 RepID=UPI00155AEF6B|nr:glycosyl hydrolase 53 family protein [Catenovulum maritimum]